MSGKTNQTTDVLYDLRQMTGTDHVGWTAHRAAEEIERLRALVRRLHEPAWAELGPAAQDVDDEFADVLPNALRENQDG